jgi:uncharacterized membrane protein
MLKFIGLHLFNYFIIKFYIIEWVFSQKVREIIILLWIRILNEGVIGAT